MWVAGARDPTSTGLAGTVVITVVAEAATVEATRAAASAGSSAGTSSPPHRPHRTGAWTRRPMHPLRRRRGLRGGPGAVDGRGIVPPALLAQLIRNGATGGAVDDAVRGGRGSVSAVGGDSTVRAVPGI